MRGLISICLPICGLSAVCAVAEELQMLTAAELAAELFGTHQFGYEVFSGMRVDECIDPAGQTVYRFQPDELYLPYSEPGQLAITENAQACFTYSTLPDPGPFCFWVFRQGSGYVFQSTDFQTRYNISEVLRGIGECPAPGEFLS